MWTKKFWLSVFERAFKTFCQGAAALLVGDGLGVLTVDWVSVGSVAALAAVISVLTSIASAGITDGSPSLASEKLDLRG